MSSPHSPPIDRPEFERMAPAFVAAMRAASQAVTDTGLDKSLTELVKVRASQINGCAFCLQYHLNLARQLGMVPAKLDLLATWRELDLYSPRERAALAWTEALTRMNQQELPAGARADLLAHFSAEEAAHLSAAIGTINAWNRIAAGLGFSPPIPAQQLQGRSPQA